MKNFDTTLNTLLAADESALFHLVDFAVTDSSTLYYCGLDIDLVYGGNRYESTEFHVDGINYSLGMAIDKLDLTFANADLALSAILLNNEVRNRDVTVYMAAMDGMDVVAAEFFRGKVTDWELDDGKNEAKLEVANEFTFWNKKTLRQYSATCQWVFKGTECGYTGAETKCNKSYSRCDALGQSDYFGGFRFLPSLEEKRIWWGRKSS